MNVFLCPTPITYIDRVITIKHRVNVIFIQFNDIPVFTDYTKDVRTNEGLLTGFVSAKFTENLGLTFNYSTSLRKFQAYRTYFLALDFYPY